MSANFDFALAKTKHLVFKSKLRGILYGETSEDEQQVISHTECGLGRWMYSHAIAAYPDIPEMTELEKVHIDIHDTARELIDMYKSGHMVEAREGLYRMEQEADKIVALLDRVEEKVTRQQKTVMPFDTRENWMDELKKLAEQNVKLDDLFKEKNQLIFSERQLLIDIFNGLPASISILRGPEFIVDMVNRTGMILLQKMEVIGKRVFDIFPELIEQGYQEILNNVYREGKTFTAKEMFASATVNGQLLEVYSDVSYVPLKDINNNVYAVISFSYDVTELVQARKKIEETTRTLQQSYDDLEVKVKFRNLELEKRVLELEQLLDKQ